MTRVGSLAAVADPVWLVHEPVLKAAVAPVPASPGAGIKYVPVKNVAAGRWLEGHHHLPECYQQPDADTLKQVVEFESAGSGASTAISDAS